MTCAWRGGGGACARMGSIFFHKCVRMGWAGTIYRMGSIYWLTSWCQNPAYIGMWETKPALGY